MQIVTHATPAGVDPKACTLELALLSADDRCGKCGRVAYVHRGWVRAFDRGAIKHPGDWPRPIVEPEPAPPIVTPDPSAWRSVRWEMTGLCPKCGAGNCRDCSDAPPRPRLSFPTGAVPYLKSYPGQWVKPETVATPHHAPASDAPPAETTTRPAPDSKPGAGRVVRLADGVERGRARRMAGDFVRLLTRALRR